MSATEKERKRVSRSEAGVREGEVRPEWSMVGRFVLTGPRMTLISLRGRPAVNFMAAVRTEKREGTVRKEIDEDLGQSTGICFDPIQTEGVVTRINDQTMLDILARKIVLKHSHHFLHHLNWLCVHWRNEEESGIEFGHCQRIVNDPFLMVGTQHDRMYRLQCIFDLRGNLSWGYTALDFVQTLQYRIRRLQHR